MTFDVVIPCSSYDSAIEKTIETLRKLKEIISVIIVDDSRKQIDFTSLIRFNITICKTKGGEGASAARNVGASLCKSNMLLFIDSDVEVSTETLKKIIETANNKDFEACTTNYGKIPPHKNYATIYKNTYMRQSFAQFKKYVPCFFASCAAIRRDIFEKVGGFNNTYKGATVEDRVFGNLLIKNGYKILILNDAVVDHWRKYTIFSVLKTGFVRAAGIIKMKKNGDDPPGSKRTGNRAFILSLPFSMLLFCFFLSSLVFQIPVLSFVMPCLFIIWFLNRSFLKEIYSIGGFMPMVFAMFLLPLDAWAHMAGIIYEYLAI